MPINKKALPNIKTENKVASMKNFEKSSTNLVKNLGNINKQIVKKIQEGKKLNKEENKYLSQRNNSLKKQNVIDKKQTTGIRDRLKNFKDNIVDNLKNINIPGFSKNVPKVTAAPSNVPKVTAAPSKFSVAGAGKGLATKNAKELKQEINNNVKIQKMTNQKLKKTPQYVFDMNLFNAIKKAYLPQLNETMSDQLLVSQTSEEKMEAYSDSESKAMEVNNTRLTDIEKATEKAGKPEKKKQKLVKGDTGTLILLAAIAGVIAAVYFVAHIVNMVIKWFKRVIGDVVDAFTKFGNMIKETFIIDNPLVPPAEKLKAAIEIENDQSRMFTRETKNISDDYKQMLTNEDKKFGKVIKPQDIITYNKDVAVAEKNMNNQYEDQKKALMQEQDFAKQTDAKYFKGGEKEKESQITSIAQQLKDINVEQAKADAEMKKQANDEIIAALKKGIKVEIENPDKSKKPEVRVVSNIDSLNKLADDYATKR